ncbi:FAD-dependent oxidoreductase [Streptomyces sp. NPDC096354]|uniref:FAD-dependent oxidoreductase n=1 Tax=Streptomyces sp. NPDC096354 TaxID=3366088 RepID=UPI00382BC9D3
MPVHTGTTTDVVIVGAGPAGLIAAHELARRGVSLRLIEKRGGPSHTTRAFTLHARSMEMFEHIGVAHRLEEVCLMCPGNVYHFNDMPDEDKPRTDFRSLPTRYPFYYKLNQNDFEQVLRDHLRATYGITPEYRKEFISLQRGTDSTDTAVTAVLLDRDTGVQERVESSWLIGCDGSKSRVRDAAHIPFSGQRVGVMAMMDVELTGFAYDDSWVNYFIGEDVFMLVTKLPGRYWRVYLSDAGAMTKADDPQASFQSVADALKIPMTIGQPHWATQWEILNNIAETYRRGRVLICGDASHVHSPAGGQGMNGCMQDAFNLGWKLAAVLQGVADEKILDSYETERKPIGEQITAGAKSTHDVVMAFGTGMADRIAQTREPQWQDNAVRLISGLAHNYRATSHTPSGLTPVVGPQAGDRAPDAVLRQEPLRRLFHVLRDPWFTLLLVPRAGDVDDLAAAARLSTEVLGAYGSHVRTMAVTAEQPAGFDFDHWIADETGEFTAAYGISSSEARAILVRPDMYVAANCRLDEAAVLIEQLREWFHNGTGGRATHEQRDVS